MMKLQLWDVHFYNETGTRIGTIYRVKASTKSEAEILAQGEDKEMTEEASQIFAVKSRQKVA